MVSNILSLVFPFQLKMFYTHFLLVFIHETLLYPPTPPTSNLFLFHTHKRDHVCASLMCDVLLILLRWIGECLIYVAETTNFSFSLLFCRHQMKHTFCGINFSFYNKIFCTMIKHIFILYKHFRLNFESNEGKICVKQW